MTAGRVAVVAVSALFGFWAVTHWAEFTAPPVAGFRGGVPPPVIRPTEFMPNPALSPPLPPPRVINPTFNHAVAEFYRRRFTGPTVPTAGRRTFLEGDQGGPVTREFSQRDDVTFLDDESFTSKNFVIPSFTPSSK